MLPEGQIIPSDEDRLLLIWQNQQYAIKNVHIIEDSLHGVMTHSGSSESFARIQINSDFDLKNSYKAGKFIIPTSAIENIAPYTIKFDALKSTLALLGSLAGIVVGFWFAFHIHAATYGSD